MWRSLAVLSVLSLIPVIQGCESKSSKKTADVPEDKKTEPGPVMPPPPPIADKVIIENFSHDPVPLLEAGQESVSVRLHWKTNAQRCQLLLGDQTIDVSSMASIVVNIPETMDVRLSCESVEALVNVPLRKKMSIVSFTVESSAEGELIRWDAFGAQSCQLQDSANALDQKDQPASGQYRVTQAVAPLNVELTCTDASNVAASARYNVSEKLKPADTLRIESFTGPAEPIRKLSGATSVPAALQWKTANATSCQLTYGDKTVEAPTSGELTIEAQAGEVFLECRGARFQIARKSLSIQTHAALELVAFKAPGGFYGSRSFQESSVELQVYGADSCELKADNAGSEHVRRITSPDDLRRLATHRVPMNIASKSLHLSCQNSFGEKFTEVMNVTVQPRIEIHKFTADPLVIKSKWTDESKRPVTLSWEVENLESCEIEKLSVTDWIPIHRFDKDVAQGQFTVEINRATDFRLNCRDSSKFVAYRIRGIKWEKQPEQSIQVKGKELLVTAHGYSTCKVRSQELGYAESFKADSQFILKGTRKVPYLMETTNFELSCSGPNGPEYAGTYTFVPKDEYFVLRQAEFKDGELHFEAAWKVRSDAQECSLYQVKGEQLDLVASGLPLQSTRSMRLAVAQNETIRMKVICGDGSDAPSRQTHLGTPEALCQQRVPLVTVGHIFDTILKITQEEADRISCVEVVARLGTVEKVNNMDFGFSFGFSQFGAYMRNVKEIEVHNTDSTHFFFYFGKARSLKIYSEAYDIERSSAANSQAFQALTGLENMDLKIRGHESVDLRYMRSSHPNLKNLRIEGFGNSPHYLGTALPQSLRGMKLQSLELHKLDLVGADLSVLLDLPLEQLTLHSALCYKTMPGESSFVNRDCLKDLESGSKKMSLKHLGMDSGNVTNLERFVDLSQVPSVYFRARNEDDWSWFQPGKPDWSAYTSLTQLKLENMASLDDFSSRDMARVKVLELGYSNKKTLSSLGALKDKFPSLTQLNLRNADAGSLFGVWQVPGLESLGLEDVSIKEWDLPLDGYQLATLVLNRYQNIKLPRGLKVERMVLNLEGLPELEAGIVNVLEFKALGRRYREQKLETLYGKVKTMILTHEQAEPLREAAKSCQLRREMQGTLLVYPPFEQLWKACEAL